MAAKPDLGFAFTLPPERAVRYFETLGYTVPADWPRRAQEAAAKAQTVAGIYRQDLVGELHQAMADAARKGMPFAAWREDVAARFGGKGLAWDKAGDLVDTATGELAGKGLTRARLETVYRTNMQSAYMAGRWQELQDNKAQMPYLQYTAVMDNRTRPRHRMLHGLIYHIDDAFWDSFYPPNGFNCRCTVTAYSARDLARRGLAVNDSSGRLEDTHIILNKRGDTAPAKALRLPDGSRFTADKGFDGNVGKRHLAQLGQLQLQRAVDLPPRIASMAIHEAFGNPLLRRAVSDDLFTAYQAIKIDRAAGILAAHPKGTPVFVGALTPAILDAMASNGLAMPQSSIIASSDKLMRHAMRDIKSGTGKTLGDDFWRASVDNIRLPEAVYYEGGTRPSLLYFYADPVDPDILYKVVITLDDDKTFARVKNPTTGKRDNLIVNTVETGTRLEKAGISWHLYTHITGKKY